MSETQAAPKGLTLGKWIVILIVGAALGGALMVREIGMQQWEVSKQYYREHVSVLQGFDSLHRAIRAGLSSQEALERVEALEAQLGSPVNGRTSLTMTRERDYLDTVRRWAKGEAPLQDVEGAFGVLVGRIALESESLKDQPYQFATSPLPGTVPVVEKKRRMI
jgi:hypothetical protein